MSDDTDAPKSEQPGRKDPPPLRLGPQKPDPELPSPEPPPRPEEEDHLELPESLKDTAEEPARDDDSAPPVAASSKPRQRLFRRMASAVSLSLVFAVFAGWGLWSQRVLITESIVQSALRETLGPGARATAERIDPEEIVLTEVQVPNGPSLQRLIIVPNPENPTSLPLNSVSIEGLRAAVTLLADGTVTIDGITLPEASPENTDTRPSDPWIPVQNLVLKDAKISAETPLGPQTLQGDLDVRLGEAPAVFPLSASIRLTSKETDSAVLLDAEIGQTIGKVDGQIDLSLQHWLPFLPDIAQADGRAALSVDLVSSALSPAALAEGGPSSLLAALDGTAGLDWTDSSFKPSDMPPLQLSKGGMGLTIGGGRVSLDLSAPIELQAEALPEIAAEAVPVVLRPYLSGAPQIAISQALPTSHFALLTPAPSDGWLLDLNAAIDLGLGPVALTVAADRLALDAAFAPTDMSLSRFSATLLRGPDLPRDVAANLEAGPVDIALADLLASGTLPAARIPFALDASIYGPIAGPVWTQQTRAVLNGSVSMTEDLGEAALILDAPGRITAEGVTGTGDLRLAPTLDIRLARGATTRVTLQPDNPLETAAFEGALIVQPTSFALPEAAPGYQASLSELPVRFEGTSDQVAVSLGPTDLAELSRDVALSGVSLEAKLSAREGSASLRADGLTVEDTPLLAGAQEIDLAMRRGDGGDLSIDGDVRLADRRIAVDVSAAVPTNANAVPSLQIETESIRLGPDGLTLEDLLPPSIRTNLPSGLAVFGDLEIDSQVSVEEGGPTGFTRVRVQQGAVTTPEGAARAIETELVIDLGAAPRTLKPVDLTTVLEVPVLGTLPFNARFSLTEALEARIEEAQLDLFDGDIALVDSRFDPADTALTGTLRLRRISLANALALAAIPGVSAEGVLSGLVPIAVGPEGVSVTDGTVASDGGGILRVDNATVNQALASNQQAMQLLSDVLKDFHYDNLGADLSLPPAGNGTIQLSLKGHNPTVLDGHPFDLNVNLKSDFRKLFNVLSDAVFLSSDLMRRTLPGFQTGG